MQHGDNRQWLTSLNSLTRLQSMSLLRILSLFLLLSFTMRYVSAQRRWQRRERLLRGWSVDHRNARGKVQIIIIMPITEDPRACHGREVKRRRHGTERRASGRDWVEGFEPHAQGLIIGSTLFYQTRIASKIAVSELTSKRKTEKRSRALEAPPRLLVRRKPRERIEYRVSERNGVYGQAGGGREKERESRWERLDCVRVRVRRKQRERPRETRPTAGR